MSNLQKEVLWRHCSCWRRKIFSYKLFRVQKFAF